MRKRLVLSIAVFFLLCAVAIALLQMPAPTKVELIGPINTSSTIPQLQTVYIPSPIAINPDVAIFSDRKRESVIRMDARFRIRSDELLCVNDSEFIASVVQDKTANATLRNEAINLLLKHAPDSLFSRLQEVVDDFKETSLMRAYATQYLGVLAVQGNNLAKTTLARYKNDACLDVRREAIFSLAKLGDSGACNLLIDALYSDREDVQSIRDLGIRFVGDLNLREHIFVIRWLGNSDNEICKIQALVTLSNWLDEESKPIFEEALKSESVRVRQAGLAGLSRFNSLESYLPHKDQDVRSLTEELNNPNPSVRVQACVSLCRFGKYSRGSLKKIVEVLGSTDASVQPGQVGVCLDYIRSVGVNAKFAGKTLLDLLPENAPIVRERQKRDVHKLRGYVLLTLSDIGYGRESSRYIAEALVNSDKEMIFNFAVAAHAVGTLGCDGYEFTPHLERALKADFIDMPLTLESYFAPLTPVTTTSARIEAIWALAKIGPGASDAIPWLQALTFTDPDSKSKVPPWKWEAKKALLAIEATKVQK